MPHYFFDTFDGEAWVIDEEGFECAHPDAALAQAQAGLGDIAEDNCLTISYGYDSASPRWPWTSAGGTSRPGHCLAEVEAEALGVAKG